MKCQNFNFIQVFVLLPCILHEISSEFKFPSMRQIMLGSMDNYKNPFYMDFITPDKKIELTHSTKKKRRSTLNQRWTKNITTPKDFMMQHLEITNKYRALHGVPPLDLDYKLSLESEEWAMELVRRSEEKGSPVLVHSGKFETGENLYAERKMANYSTTGARVAAKWYSQCREHTWNPNFFTGNSARFTQMVWKNTERMGIAFATSEKMGFTVVVARYLPCGNWGYLKPFEENVFPQTKLKDGITKCFKHKRSENISTLQIAFPTRHTKQINISPVANATKKELSFNDALIVDKDEELVTSTLATESNSNEKSFQSDEYVYSYEEDISYNVSRTLTTTHAPKGKTIQVSKNNSISPFAHEKSKEEKRQDKDSSAHSKNKKSEKKSDKMEKKNTEIALEAKNKRETNESSSSMDKKHNSTSNDAEKRKKKDGGEKEKSDEIEMTEEDERKEETTEASEKEVDEKKKKNGTNDSHSKTSKHKHETDKESKSKEHHTDKSKEHHTDKSKEHHTDKSKEHRTDKSKEHHTAKKKEKTSNKNIKTLSNSSLANSSQHSKTYNKSKDKKADESKKSSDKSDSDSIKKHDKNKKSKNK